MRLNMTVRKTRALQVPPVVPYKALEKFSKALYGTTGGTYSARIFRPVMFLASENGKTTQPGLDPYLPTGFLPCLPQHFENRHH